MSNESEVSGHLVLVLDLRVDNHNRTESVVNSPVVFP